MGYPQRLGNALFPTTTVAQFTPLLLTAAAATYSKFAVMQPITAKRMIFYVTTASTAGSVSAVICVKKHVTYNVSAGQVTIGLMTIASSTAGAVLYKDLTPAVLNVGDELVFQVNTAASADVHGAGILDLIYDLEPETSANNSDMTSA